MQGISVDLRLRSGSGADIEDADDALQKPIILYSLVRGHIGLHHQFRHCLIALPHEMRRISLERRAVAQISSSFPKPWQYSW